MAHRNQIDNIRFAFKQKYGRSTRLSDSEIDEIIENNSMTLNSGSEEDHQTLIDMEDLEKSTAGS